MAVDRDRLVTELFRGSATKADSSLPPRLHRAIRTNKAVRFDPAQARAALSGASLTSRTLRLYVLAEGRAWLPEPKLAARILVRGFRAAGIKVEPVHLLYKDLKQACEEAGEHDMVVQGWTPDYPDPENVYWLLSSKSRLNLARFQDQEFEDLLEQARTAPQVDKRRALYLQLESIIETKRPWLPLAYVAGHVVRRSELKDARCRFSYSGHVDLRGAYFKR